MIGRTIAHYKILEKLGQGGMGEVYLALDTKLDRKVALKFLPEHLALEGEVKARFMQEAKAAAAFSHPNVCAVYDVLEHNGRMFIVMEYVDGQTLQDKKGTLSVTQVVEIMAQVADGLAAAHQQGIVHRDIKSENIMVRKDGIAQITDFGLAKLKGVTSRLTKEGSTLGTTGYMSPEQALGQDVDHRSDIFSLGVVLFELLTGEMPFTGAHEAAIMYEIVNVDSAPPTAVNPELDPELDRIVLECLQKEPDERYQSAREVAKDLRRFKRDSGRKRVSRISQSRVSASRAPSRSPSVTSRVTAQDEFQEAPASSKSSWLPWVIVGVLAIACGLFAFLLTRSADTQARQLVRFSLEPPKGHSVTLLEGNNLATSPDGTMLAFVAANAAGERQIWIRAIGEFDARPLVGTERASYPFWSPDSRFLGFFSQGKMKKIDVTGGPALTLCDAPLGRGGSWNRDGVIIFAPDQQGWLFRVSAAGGEPEPLTSANPTRGEQTHRWPVFLPDGNRFLYYSRAAGSGSQDAVMLDALDHSMQKIVMYHNANVAYANGYLLFVRENVLMAQPFDLATDTLVGTPRPLAEGAHLNGRFNCSEFSVSPAGVLSYLKGGSQSNARLLEVDREGRLIDTIGGDEDYRNFHLSPDGDRLAVAIGREESQFVDIWITDLTRDITSRMTFDSLSHFQVAWSPDGQRVAYATFSPQSYRVYTKAISGAGDAVLVLDTTIMVRPSDWSHDGRYLLCRIKKGESSTEDRTIAIPINPDGTPTSDAPFEVGDAQGDVDVGAFSPDGRWFTYSSDETGRYEVYVRPFPGPGGKWQVSANGGDLPRWSADGKEIYFVNNDYDAILAAPVDASESSVRVGKATTLFQTSLLATMSPYDVSSDGQKFYLLAERRQEDEGRIRVILNWDTELADK